MKICFFPHYSFSNRDGAILSMYDIIHELLKRGVEIVVVIPNKNNLYERFNDKRIDFVYVPMYSMRMAIDKMTLTTRVKFEGKFLYNQVRSKEITNILKVKDIDCIHINGLDSFVGAKVAKQLGIPYVWHIRSYLEEDLGKKLCHQKEVYEYVSQANAVIAISDDVRKKFEGILGRSVRLIYNGVPQETFDNPHNPILKDRKVKLLLVGRISVQKGQMLAIKAIEILRDKAIEDVTLTIVGQAETKEYFQQVVSYITEHHLEQLVVLKNHMDDLLKIRQQHDVGLICSRREAFGRVTVENMMAGLLVIGANSGATPEIITDGINGFLFQESSPRSLAETIQNVLRNREQARVIAKKGYEDALERYSIRRVVDEVVHVYESVM